MKNNYRHYFKKHYAAKFAWSDVARDRQWFFTQFGLISSLVKIRPEDRVLEIGSGFGGLYSFLEQKNYLGLDMDPEVVDFTNRIFKTDKFINCSLEDFSTPQNFDFIFAIEVLEHLENPMAGIIKIKDLLKKKGHFVGTTPYPFAKNIFADQTHNFVLHPENWKRLFLRAGFSRFDYYPMSFFPFLWRISRFLNPRLPLYLPFKYFISTTLIVARK